MSENIRVCCRVRPSLGEQEEGTAKVVTVGPDGKTVQISSGSDTHEFQYDKVFSEYADQEDIFNGAVEGLVETVCGGVNAAIIAYGQTGSGKTHTMEGNASAEELRGVTPRVLHAIFQRVQHRDPHESFYVSCSAIQIYKERLFDLLAADDKKAPACDLMEDANRGMWVTNAVSTQCENQRDVEKLLAMASEGRYVAETKQNSESSRSHLVFLLSLVRKDLVDFTERSAQLYLVDLAGSECVEKTQSVGERLEEAKHINTSLFTLRRVIQSLVAGKSHVPYRDSKLTRLLQNSFGGNAKTTLIVCVSPSSFNASESLSSLRFGSSTREITNSITVNVHRSAEELEKLINETNQQIFLAKASLHQLQEEFSRADAASGDVGGVQGPEEYDIDGMGMKRSSTVLSVDESTLPEHFRCPLSKKCMINPVVAVDGVTYEHAAITNFMDRYGRTPRPPRTTVTGGVPHLLLPNYVLRDQITAYNNEMV